MKVYKPIWRRLFGVFACFTLGCFLIAMSSEPQDNRIINGDSDSEPQTTSLSQAISFVGGKLKLLVVYNSNGVQDRNEEYNDEDIVGEENPDSQYENEDENYNANEPTFQKGDFDYNPNSSKTTVEPSDTTTTVTVSSTQPVKRIKRLKFGSNPSGLNRFKSHATGVAPVRNGANLTLVEDGVFWGRDIEALVPKVITDEEVGSFLHRMHRLKVKSVQPPTWNRCGRPKNQYVVFEDGTQVCARYRAPHDYLVQGEVMSFYLSRLLGIFNVPPVTLLSIDQNDQWADLKVNKSIEAAGWSRNSTVAVIQWIESLERDRMPQLLLDALENGQTISEHSEELRNSTSVQLVELLQWSDLILFDYVTGNYDRVASMQDAADKEQKPSILGETIHNLVKSRNTGSVWLIDNESGLLDAYSLLYSEGGPVSKNSIASPDTNRFINFHRKMLNTMCVFRKSTYQRLKWLSRQERPIKVLLTFINRYEPNFTKLPSVAKYTEFLTNFRKRLGEAYAHTKKCRTLL